MTKIENLSPYGERAIVEIMMEDMKTESGLIIPGTAEQFVMRGKIISKGSLNIQGNYVFFEKESGKKIRLSGKDYLILSKDEILAVE